MRWPGESHEQPHQECGGDRETPLIEEADWDGAKNQVWTSPEPYVLMKYVECDDSNDQQDFFHSGLPETDLINKRRPEVSKGLSECQAMPRKGLPAKTQRRKVQTLRAAAGLNFAPWRLGGEKSFTPLQPR